MSSTTKSHKPNFHPLKYIPVQEGILLSIIFISLVGFHFYIGLNVSEVSASNIEYVILLLLAYHFWRGQQLSPSPVHWSARGLSIAIVTCTGLRLWNSYDFESEPFIVALPIIAIALSLLILGWVKFAKALPLLLVFAFLGTHLSHQIGYLLPFKEITAASATYGLHYLGFDVVRDGKLMTLSSGIVSVEQSCTGWNLIIFNLQIIFAISLLQPSPRSQSPRSQWALTALNAVVLGFFIGVIRVMFLATIVTYPQTFDYWHGKSGNQIFTVIAIVVFGLMNLELIDQVSNLKLQEVLPNLDHSPEFNVNHTSGPVKFPMLLILAILTVVNLGLSLVSQSVATRRPLPANFSALISQGDHAHQVTSFEEWPWDLTQGFVANKVINHHETIISWQGIAYRASLKHLTAFKGDLIYVLRNSLQYSDSQKQDNTLQDQGMVLSYGAVVLGHNILDNRSMSLNFAETVSSQQSIPYILTHIGGQNSLHTCLYSNGFFQVKAESFAQSFKGAKDFLRRVAKSIFQASPIRERQCIWISVEPVETSEDISIQQLEIFLIHMLSVYQEPPLHKRLPKL
jgi:exosortase/archaeosortase family protein